MITKTGLANHIKKRDDLCILYWQNPKVIFLKTPKVAGTSMLKVLVDRLGEPKRYFKDWEGEFSDKVLGDYFIFSFVRNPWDKMVSLWKFMGRSQTIYRILTDHRKITKSTRFHARPCHVFTHLNGNQFVDFIGRYESLQEDFNKVCDLIGIKRANLPMLNTSKHDHYSKYYIEDMREMVAKKYAKDIELFGYVFEENDAK